MLRGDEPPDQSAHSMNKNGILAVVVVVAAVILIGLWVLRTGQQRAGARQFDCAASPDAPVNLQHSKAAADLVRLTWGPPAAGERPTTYVLEAGTGEGKNDVGTFVAAGSATSMDRPAPPGRYFVRLFARNACGTSPASNEIVVTMP
jgi:hypothetical protein